MNMYEILSHAFFFHGAFSKLSVQSATKTAKKCIFSAIIIHKSFLGLNTAIKINSMKKKKLPKNTCTYIHSSVREKALKIVVKKSVKKGECKKDWINAYIFGKI